MRPHESPQGPGARIRATREANGISLRQLERLEPKLDRGRVSRIERGMLRLTVRDLHAIAKALGMAEVARVLRPFVDFDRGTRDV